MLEISIAAGLSIAAIAFVAEFTDSSLGMGYGTSLTPILLLMGYEPVQVVPAILMSEFVTGILAGLVHHLMGNARFGIKTLNPARISSGIRKYGIVGSFTRGFSLHSRVMMLIAACSIAGAASGALITVSLPAVYLKAYIGALILAVGLYILLTLRKKWSFSWRKLGCMALVASFNKGISGGGYGPVVTGGQLLSGVEGKSAVAVTSLAEGITCVAGLSVFLFYGRSTDWALAPWLLAGGVLSIPLSGLVVKKMNGGNLRLLIGIVTVVLGCITILKVLM